MKRISKKQKLIILISIITIIVVIGIIIGANVIKVNILTGKYNTANKDSNNGNLLPEYIKAGITLGGVTGTLEDLDTSDATATPEDILYGKTAYVDGKKITGTYRTISMLQIGDYVAYTPDTTQTSYSISSIYSGYDTNQTIKKDNLSWQVLSVNDDGTVDLISSTPTSEMIYFKGATGYNNGVYFLNDIAAKLYSNNSLGVIARNLKIEDIEKHMTEEKLNDAHSYSNAVQWGKSKTYTSNTYTYYPNLYAYENGSGINTSTVKTDGIGKSDSYYSSPTTESSSQAGTNGLTVTQTYYPCSLKSSDYDSELFYNLIHNSEKICLLSSRAINTYNDHADFCLSFLCENRIDGYLFLHSNNFPYAPFGYLRPVVSLNSNTKIGSGDGKSSGTAYEIIG